MSATKPKVTSVDLALQLFQNNVTKKPPVPHRPTSGQFQNRGKLFPNTSHNKLFEQDRRTPSTVCNTLVLHSTAADVIENEHVPTNTPRDVPRYCRRTKSAKARTTTKREPSKPGISCIRRPITANNAYRHKQSRDLEKIIDGEVIESELQVAVIDLANNVKPDLKNISREKQLALPDPRHYCNDTHQDVPPMHFTRPSSAKCERETDTCACRKTEQINGHDHLKPSVLGLERNRLVSGSAPDLMSSVAARAGQFPYKLSPEVTDGDEPVEGGANGILHGSRHIPETLAPLVPWLVHDISQDVIGVDPRTCLVFLPQQDNMVDLPVVPEPHGVEDDLPFVRDVSTPKPWKPKKYPHPFNKQPVEEWICKHNSGRESHGHHEWKTIYKTLRLPRMRTADVIKKEISDLEKLLRGEGNRNSNCAMVQYQSDVTELQDMLDVTMEMVPDRLKNPPERPDLFGLNRMCTEHDGIVEEIRQRVAECRLELADLEVEAGIDTDRQYFRTRRSSVC